MSGTPVAPISPPVSLPDLSEKEWQGQVVKLARTLGWKIYHPFDSRRSARGWPDLSLVRERLVCAELKTEHGKLTRDQREWLTALAQAGAEVYLWRPSDLAEAGAVLAGRWTYGLAHLRRPAGDGRVGELWPGSMWLASGETRKRNAT